MCAPFHRKANYYVFENIHGSSAAFSKSVSKNVRSIMRISANAANTDVKIV